MSSTISGVAYPQESSLLYVFVQCWEILRKIENTEYAFKRLMPLPSQKLQRQASHQEQIPA